MEEVYISDAQFNDYCNTKPFFVQKKATRRSLVCLFDEEAGDEIDDGCQQCANGYG
jgi:hypothetical protein